MPDPLLENAKRLAEEQGTTFSALVEDALRCFMAERPKGSSAPFRLHTVKGVLVNPDLDLNRISALIATDDEGAYHRK